MFPDGSLWGGRPMTEDAAYLVDFIVGVEDDKRITVLHDPKALYEG